ncbi:PEGA domain-containing protein [Haliangium sp.]|uniref:PEGA domain-containing protein n=1 Tax=Haliangium sp. TaxID=2663208 RepID=UPI003D129C5E
MTGVRATLAMVLLGLAGPDGSIEPADAQPQMAPEGDGEFDGTSAEAVEAPLEHRPWAEGVAAAAQARAEELFEEGNLLFEDQFFAQAADKYREGLEYWDHPAMHYNLALALVALDRPLELYEHLGRAVEHGPDVLGKDKYDYAVGYRRLVAQQLAEISLSCDNPEARVSIDGEVVLVGPGQLKKVVRVGEHTVAANLPGHVPYSRRVALSPSQQLELPIHMYTLDEATALQRRWAAWKPWSTLAGGVVVVAAGGIVHWQSQRRFGDYDSDFGGRCGQGCMDGDVPSLTDERVRAEREQQAAVVAYAVGSALILTGAVLTYLNQPKRIRLEGYGGEGETDLAVQPALTTSGVGVQAKLRF